MMRTAWRASARLPFAPWAALCLGFCIAALAPRAFADSLDTPRVHWEIGVLSDVTNELFMQDSYSDTTFVSRRLVGSPEYRTGAVASLDWSRGTRGEGLLLTMRPDVVIGDKLTRVAVTSSLRRSAVDRWSWSVEPSAQLTRDRGFDLDRREVGGGLLAKARREVGWARDQALECRAGGDLLEVFAPSQSYALSHRNAHIGVAYDRSGFDPLELRVEARSYARTFPDSVSRDHLEQQVQLSLSRDFGGLHVISLRAGGSWRSTVHEVPSSRDRFALYEAQSDWTLHFGLRHSLQLQADVERTMFVRPDSVLDFDYDLLRASSRWSWRFGGASHVSAGARLEWLSAAWNPVERYREAAVTAEYERFTIGSWMVISPALLWRRYEVTSTGSGFDLQLAHSHFDGVELFAMLEQSVPGGLRVRSTGVGRIEWHRNSSDNARSLYFSLDVRRLF